MTDNDIIKALEWCVNEPRGYKCSQCEYVTGCKPQLMRNALDLINRQKAEIERLEHLRAGVSKEVERLHNILLSFTNEVSMWSNRKGYDTTELSLIPILNKAKNIKAEVRAETITEFAERLKATPMRFHVEYVEYYDKPSIEKMVLFIDDNDIDQIAKEMKGEQ